MNLDEEGNTEELVRLAAQGDPDSVAALARRNVSSLFDFAVRVTLDETTAKSVVESTLDRAVGKLADRPANLSFDTWMFGIARDEALDSMRARGREGSESGQLSPLDDRFIHLADATRDPDMALWTWQAARAQRPRDYSLLDLAIRRRIPHEEIADIASLSRSGIYAVLGRLRGAFEESFFTSTLYFRGRQDCADLEKLVTEATSLGPALRRDIGRHADGCPVCKETRNGLTLAADILGSFTNVPVPHDLLDHLALEPAPASTAAVETIATLAPGFAVDPAGEPEALAADEPVVSEGELAAILPAEVALDGQTVETEEDTVPEDELLEEAALLLPETEPEAEAPALEEPETVAEPATELEEEQAYEQAEVEAEEAHVAVPVASGLAGAGLGTVLAAAEDAIVAGSAATVVPQALQRNGSSVPATEHAGNGAGPLAAVAMPALNEPVAGDATDVEGPLAPAIQPEEDIPDAGYGLEAPDALVMPVEADDHVEAVEDALVADAPAGPDAEIEAPEASPGIAERAALLAGAAAATELVTPDTADAGEADVEEEPVEDEPQTTKPEDVEKTVVDDDGAVTAVDDSETPEDSVGGSGRLEPVAAGAALCGCRRGIVCRCCRRTDGRRRRRTTATRTDGRRLRGRQISQQAQPLALRSNRRRGCRGCLRRHRARRFDTQRRRDKRPARRRTADARTRPA